MRPGGPLAATVSERRWPFISAAASEQRKAIASAMCSAGVKEAKSPSGLSSRIRGVRIASTTTMFAVAGAAGEAVGERQRPGLGRRLGGGVGGVGVGRRLRLLGGDEDEATRARRRRAHRGRRAWCAGRCGSAGRGAAPSRRAAPRAAAARRASRRPGEAARRPGRSARAAPRTSPAPPPRRAGRQPARPSARPAARAPPRTSSIRAWSRSVPATIAPRRGQPLGHDAAPAHHRSRRWRRHGRREPGTTHMGEAGFEPA